MNNKTPTTTIKNNTKKIGITIDVLMLWLTILDLLWLMFDAAYSTQTIQLFVDGVSPFDYQAIHQNFYFYDSFIVSIFIVEFIGRWFYSVYKKIYGKWFFYPFFHWYDILGCFPTGSFRILRLLRIIGLVYKLHRWKVINLNNYALYNKAKEYYHVIMEEFSDRVVVTILTEAKNEIKTGKPLAKAIIDDIIQPKKAKLIATVGEVIQDGIQTKYPHYQKTLENHIKEVVQEKVGNNKEVKKLARVPVIGNQIRTTLNVAVGEIVFGVIDHLIQDTAKPQNNQMLQLVISSVMEVMLEHEILQHNELGNELILETIDLIIKRVKVQQWKNNIK